MHRPTENPQEQVSALLSICADSQASTAHLLCDRHDPAAIAFTLVGKDLSCVDVSYGALRAQSERLAAALVAKGFARCNEAPADILSTREWCVYACCIGLLLHDRTDASPDTLVICACPDQNRRWSGRGRDPRFIGVAHPTVIPLGS